MTFREMQGAIGQAVMYVPRSHDSLQFVCLVKDVRTSFGAMQVMISPMSGYGETWVEFSTLRPMPQVTNGRVSTESTQGRLTTGVISATIVKR